MNAFRKLRAFLRLLKGARWHFLHGAIRTKVDGAQIRCCPLTYVHYVKTGEVISVGSYPTAAEGIGLGDYGETIANAADEAQREERRLLVMRRVLRRACNLRGAFL